MEAERNFNLIISARVWSYRDTTVSGAFVYADLLCGLS